MFHSHFHRKAKAAESDERKVWKRNEVSFVLCLVLIPVLPPDQNPFAHLSFRFETQGHRSLHLLLAKPLVSSQTTQRGFKKPRRGVTRRRRKEQRRPYWHSAVLVWKWLLISPPSDRPRRLFWNGKIKKGSTSAVLTPECRLWSEQKYGKGLWWKTLTT